MGSTIDEGTGTRMCPIPSPRRAGESSGLEVVAGSRSSNRRNATPSSQKWGVETVFEDFPDMLAREQLDLVAVCVPSGGLPKRVNTAPDPEYRGDAHADIGIAVSEAGIPMLYLEKAIACSMARADELRDVCTGNVHSSSTPIVLQRRFNSGFQVVSGCHRRRRHR